MTKFHEMNLPKWRRVTGYALSILFSFEIIMGGLMKIITHPEMTKNMASLGAMHDNMRIVGIGEIILLALYWFPRTQKLGFYLMCSFVGGIIATEIIAGRPIAIGISTAAFLYAGTVLRFPSLLSFEGMKRLSLAYKDS